MNEDNKAGVIFAIICFSIIILCGNLFLFFWIAGDTPDGQGVDGIGKLYAIFALIVDIILIFVIPNWIKEKVNEKKIIQYNRVKQNTIELLSSSSAKMELIVAEIKKYNDSSALCEKTLKLLSFSDSSVVSKNLLEYFYNVEDQRYIKSCDRIFEAVTNKNDVPNNYAELQTYLSKLEVLIKENDKTISDINNDIYDEKGLKYIIKKTNNKKYQEIKKSDGKRILTISLLFGGLLILTVSAVCVLCSPTIAANKAKDNYLEKYYYQEILQTQQWKYKNGLEDIILTNCFEEVSSTYKNKNLEFKIVAKSNDISKYYTTEKFSEKAESLFVIMKDMYEIVKHEQYTYKHSNGWTVNIIPKKEAEVIIEDSIGHKYTYWALGDSECLTIDGKDVYWPY